MIAGVAAVALTGIFVLANPGGVDTEVAVSLVAPQCQPHGQLIQVELAPPGFDEAAALPWSTDSLTLTGIAPGCIGHRYQVSVTDPSGWRPVRLGNIAGTSISIPLPDFGPDGDRSLALAILPPGDTSLT